MRNEWMTEELMNLINKKNDLWIKITKHSNPTMEMLEEYKRMKKCVKVSINVTKQEFYNNYFTTHYKDSFKIWNKINSLIGKNNTKGNIDAQLKETFKNENTKTLCERFANNFNEQVPRLKQQFRYNNKKMNQRKDIGTSKTRITSLKTISLLNITTLDVLDTLNALKLKKSAGYDGFQLEHFIKTKENTSKFMKILINSIIETEIWPDDLKRQVLRPIFKKGDKKDLNNYRPIALLPVLNKIVEKIFATRIENFLNKYCKLNVNQFGFRKGIGTVDALHSINNNITRALNEGKHVGAIMIDLQKAFDTLEKDIIIEKLYKHGIRGKMLNILISYLTKRLCSVKIENEMSDWVEVKYGVPQGSVLGPLLFLIFINDIQEIDTNTYITLYADDIFMLSINTDCYTMIHNLQQDFNNVNNYLSNNDLYLSSDKTCFMHIKTSHMNSADITNIKIIAHVLNCVNSNSCSCKPISNVKNAKYLGLEIDHNWKFYKHIDILTSRIRKTIPILYRIRTLLNNKNKRQLFESIILSVSRYACNIYGTTSCGLIDRIQILHNKAIKVLFNCNHKYKHASEIYKEQKLLTFRQIMEYNILTQNYFKPNFKIPNSRAIRNNNYWLKLPIWRNSYGKRGQVYTIPQTFNKLPSHLREIQNVNSVKKLIKNWITV